jgi:hypothetical protein
VTTWYRRETMGCPLGTGCRPRRFEKGKKELPSSKATAGKRPACLPLDGFSCPGWSFYGHAGEPGKDIDVQNALNSSDAPSWAAVEWLFRVPREMVA